MVLSLLLSVDFTAEKYKDVHWANTSNAHLYELKDLLRSGNASRQFPLEMIRRNPWVEER